MHREPFDVLPYSQPRIQNQRREIHGEGHAVAISTPCEAKYVALARRRPSSQIVALASGDLGVENPEQGGLQVLVAETSNATLSESASQSRSRHTSHRIPSSAGPPLGACGAPDELSVTPTCVSCLSAGLCV